MFRSLRNRLILSHILPALLIIPLMGAALVFVLENQLLLPMIYGDLADDATLMAAITRNQSVFWQNRLAAQALIDGVSPHLSGAVAFVTIHGRVLASSDPAERGVNAQTVDLPDLASLVQGDVVQFQRGPLAEVYTPVFDLSGNMIGIIRMTSHVVSVSDEIYQLRYLLAAVLAFGVLGGIGLGSYLAVQLNRPIQKVTHSIRLLADGNWQLRLEEQGPEELRTLAEAVNTLVARLNSLEQARRQLLANLVHELGRPLGAIRSAIQALGKGAAKDPSLAKDLLIGLDDETARLHHLLDDLSGLHGQVLGKLELRRITVQPKEWIFRTMAPWESATREKGLTWETDIQNEMPEVLMDPDRMAQALGNLLSNAIKFTHAGGKVSLRAYSSNRQFILQVTDSGPGITVDEQEKIFQPFYRAVHGSSIVQGMGLGLSIARDIVKAHGGEIELQSEPGSGSRFIIRLPVGPGQPD